jgi:hypothetical protein
MESGEILTEVAFFQVPLPQSGDLVSYLSHSKTVEFAAAVYSGVDVVGVLDGAKGDVDTSYEDFLSGEAPIRSVDRFPADEVIAGAGSTSRQLIARGACTAFVRCAIRVPDVEVSYASSVLSSLPGVVRLFPNADQGEIVLEVVANGKRDLDHVVMHAIQGKAGIVKSTRTYAVINDMQWRRQESGLFSHVFVGLAEADVAFVRRLRQRLEAEREVRCWMYEDIPLGTKSWTELVDEAIESARCHVFVWSKAALKSTECAREFGLASALSDPDDICCLVLPDCDISDLPTRYQERQCLKVDDFFSYPRFIDWLLNRDEREGATHHAFT